MGPQCQVLVLEVPKIYQRVKGAWPTSNFNLGPIGPKPDPVDPAEVISIFVFKKSLMRGGRTSVGTTGSDFCPKVPI